MALSADNCELAMEVQSKRTVLQNQIALWSLLAVGTILRLRQYLTFRSLWADEASLAFNLANRTFGGLTQPLDYQQGAPVGFLFIEKLFLVLLGNKDYILRLFPLFAGIISIYLFYRIASSWFNGILGVVAASIFAVSWHLVYYSSELKQYSSDVMVALLLIHLSGNCFREKARAWDFLILGAAGALGIWISHPSFFILAAIGLALVLHKLTRNRELPWVWIFGLGTAWLVSFGLEYFVSLQHLVANEFLQHYWRKAFMPIPPWDKSEWFAKAYASVLYISLDRTDLVLKFIIPGLVFLGSISFLVRNRACAIITLLPFLETLLASGLQRYPFKDRFILFLVPLLLLLVTAGLHQAYTLISKWNRRLALATCGTLALVLFFLPVQNSFLHFVTPYNKADIKPVLEYVSEKRKVDDIVYVFHGADPAFNYYAPFYGLTTGQIIVGFDTTDKEIALDGFYKDVEKLKGNERVWFIFSDIVDCGNCEGDKQAFYVTYLDGLGALLEQYNAPGANGYLYDLSP